MAVYTEDQMLNELIKFATGDSFEMNGTNYAVEYVLPYQRFYADTLYKKPEDADDIVVVSYKAEGGRVRYLVAASGDWEGCSAEGDSIQEVLAYELMRVHQWAEQR